jgi:hypothetical protein
MSTLKEHCFLVFCTSHHETLTNSLVIIHTDVVSVNGVPQPDATAFTPLTGICWSQEDGGSSTGVIFMNLGATNYPQLHEKVNNFLRSLTGPRDFRALKNIIRAARINTIRSPLPDPSAS